MMVEESKGDGAEAVWKIWRACRCRRRHLRRDCTDERGTNDCGGIDGRGSRGHVDNMACARRTTWRALGAGIGEREMESA